VGLKMSREEKSTLRSEIEREIKDLRNDVGGRQIGRVMNFIEWNSSNYHELTDNDSIIKFDNVTVKDMKKLANKLVMAALQDLLDNR